MEVNDGDAIERAQEEEAAEVLSPERHDSHAADGDATLHEGRVGTGSHGEKDVRTRLALSMARGGRTKDRVLRPPRWSALRQRKSARRPRP